MTWTEFRHNFGPNETSGANTRSGDYERVVVQTDKETAITWWEKKFEKDPTRVDGWYDTHFDDAWDITEYASEDGLLAAVGEIELENSGSIGQPMTRAATMKDLHDDDQTLVAQPQVMIDDGIMPPEEAAERAGEATEGVDIPDHADGDNGPPDGQGGPQ